MIVFMFRVLIVEDNVDYRAALKSVLTCRFSEVVVETAADGKEMFEKVQHFSPDLVLMDIQLPGRNALILTKILKHMKAKR